MKNIVQDKTVGWERWMTGTHNHTGQLGGVAITLELPSFDLPAGWGWGSAVTTTHWTAHLRISDWMPQPLGICIALWKYSMQEILEIQLMVDSLSIWWESKSMTGSLKQNCQELIVVGPWYLPLTINITNSLEIPRKSWNYEAVRSTSEPWPTRY